jgi:hypothetical protein
VTCMFSFPQSVTVREEHIVLKAQRDPKAGLCFLLFSSS